MDAHKQCSICKQFKESSAGYFYRDKKSADGLFGMCKDCKRAKDKTYREQNADKRRGWYDDYRKKNPEKIAQYQKKTRENSKEKISAYDKEYRIAHKDQINARRRQNKNYVTPERQAMYRKADKENCQIRGHKYRAIKRELESDFSKSDWESCLNFFNHKCAYCGEAKQLTKEHLIPVSRGGGFTKNNIIPICHRCNCSKSGQNFESWYLCQPFYDKQRRINILNYTKGV